MEPRWPDGAVFHGVGITPDVEVALTAADIAAGHDADLGAAITYLRGLPVP